MKGNNMGRPKQQVQEELTPQFKIGVAVIALAIYLLGIVSVIGYHATVAHIEKNGVNKYLKETTNDK